MTYGDIRPTDEEVTNYKGSFSEEELAMIRYCPSKHPTLMAPGSGFGLKVVLRGRVLQKPPGVDSSLPALFDDNWIGLKYRKKIRCCFNVFIYA